MFNATFGDLTFDYGFERDLNLFWLGQSRQITLYLLAYELEDSVTLNQERAYQAFQKQQQALLELAEKEFLIQFGQAEANRFDLTSLFISREGELALLLNDQADPENDLAIQLLPQFSIFRQSDYL